MTEINPDNKTNAFKKNPAKVPDDDLRTRPLRWNNYVDIVIITMIVLSTVSVFLTTFTLLPAWQRALMLKRDMAYSSDEKQIREIFAAEIAENVKKGWVEV